jgi:hypothetical protein
MAASSSAIRAGRAFVELFADPVRLNRALDAAKKRVEQFVKFTAKIGLGAAAIGGSVLAPITKVLTETVTRGAAIDSLAKRFNLTTESVSGLAYAFERVGLSFEDYEGTLDGFNAKLIAAADGNDELFRRLGLNARALIEMPLDQAFLKVADAFNRIKGSGDRAVKAEELFGSSGLKLLPVLQKGAQGFRDLHQEAAKAGALLSAEDAAQSTQILRNLTEAWQLLKYVVLQIGSALLPTAKEFTEVGREIKGAAQQARGWIQQNKAGIVAVTAVAAAFIVAAIALGGLSAAVSIAIPLLAILKASIAVLSAMVGAVLSPVGLAVAAIAAVAAGLIYLWSTTEQGRGTLADISSAFSEFADFLKDSWKGIGDAVSAGDWTLAFQIGIATADVAWKKIVNGITIVWVGFKDTFVDVWREAVAGIRMMVIDLSAFIAKAISQAIYTQVDIWNAIVGKMGRAGRSLKIDLAGVLNTPEQVDKLAEEWKDKIGNEKEADNAKSIAARTKQLGDAQDAVNKAEKTLKDLNRKAAEEAKAADKKPGPARPQAPKQPQDIPSFQQLYAAAKGIFSGPAQLQLGYGDNTAQRQIVDNTKTTANNTEATAVESKKLSDKFDGLIKALTFQ